LPPKDWQDLSRTIVDDAGPSACETGASPSSSYPNKPKANRRIRDMRRSERVPVEMLVDVCVCSDEEDDPDPVFTRGKTLDVSAHGALLDVAMPVDIGQTLRMINVRTKREIECHVLRFAKRYPEGGGQIGVEFAGVSRHFWGISSPPPNWDSDWVPSGQVDGPISQGPPSALSTGVGTSSATDALPGTDNWTFLAGEQTTDFIRDRVAKRHPRPADPLRRPRIAQAARA